MNFGDCTHLIYSYFCFKTGKNGGKKMGRRQHTHNIPTRSSQQVFAEVSQSLETWLINNAPQWQRKSQRREENMLEHDYMTLALWPDCSWWFLLREKIPHTTGMEKGKRWGPERGPQRVVCSDWLMGPSAAWQRLAESVQGRCWKIFR